MVPWNVDELAFIIDWTDHCLLHGLNYRDTIVEAYEASFQTERTADNIRSRLIKLAKAYSSAGKDAKYSRFVVQESHYLDCELPDDLKEALDRQRRIRRTGLVETPDEQTEETDDHTSSDD